jgi:hypothetical protein
VKVINHLGDEVMKVFGVYEPSVDEEPNGAGAQEHFPENVGPSQEAAIGSGLASHGTAAEDLQPPCDINGRPADEPVGADATPLEDADTSQEAGDREGWQRPKTADQDAIGAPSETDDIAGEDLVNVTALLDEIAPPQDAGDNEDWDTLESAEEDLVEAISETIELPLEELVSGDEEPFEGDDTERLLLDLEKEVTESELEVARSPDGDETLDTNWEEETDQFDSFDAFAVGWEAHAHPGDDLGLYEYEEDAQQPIWGPEPLEGDAAIQRARAKADTVTSLLDLNSKAEQNRALHFLTELFEHLSHSATYGALQRLAADGLDFDELKSMVALRRFWTERTEWWLYRYRGEICFHKHGAAALTWKLAHRVCMARWQFSPETMIDEEWLDEWLTLPSGSPGYLSFPDFIAGKVGALDAEALHTGLLIHKRSSRPRDLNDDYDWHHRVTDRYGVIGRSFHILTPFDSPRD